VADGHVSRQAADAFGRDMSATWPIFVAVDLAPLLEAIPRSLTTML